MSDAMKHDRLMAGAENGRSFDPALRASLRMTPSTLVDPSEEFEEADEHFDKLREECGVMAVYNHSDAARLTYWGLYALQHRGQESAGIASADGRR